MVKRGNDVGGGCGRDPAVPLIGVIPDDEHVVVATNQGEPITGSASAAGTAYQNISRRINGGRSAIPGADGKKSFFRRIFKKVGGISWGMFHERKQFSGTVARERLATLLSAERLACSPRKYKC